MPQSLSGPTTDPAGTSGTAHKLSDRMPAPLLLPQIVRCRGGHTLWKTPASNKPVHRIQDWSDSMSGRAPVVVDGAVGVDVASDEPVSE